ncbi:MAG: hypothetical protein EOO74_06300 [Myxococcales bacterium]|nr:MAG: hypothetical protein EOO74_06300 [Myxococcales bacterium]
MSRRVFLHIGAPKSGTSFLQDRFAANRDLLAEQGLTYPATRADNHFEAALDLIERPWAGELEKARGQWDALVAAAAKAKGDVLISHEILAAATPEQIERARMGFVGDEWHVIYTMRDLGRQLPAEWQEMVKHRSAMRFRGFMKKVQAQPPASSDFWFWRVQSLPDVLTRWGKDVDPAHIHLVTVPPPGGPGGALWERFCSVVGLDPDLDYDDAGTTNASIGVPEVAALRRLNQLLRAEGVSRDVYVPKVRELIVREVFSRRDTDTAKVPDEWHDYVDEIADGWVEWIEGSGVDVVGDVNDLVPQWGDEPVPHPDRPNHREVAEAAIEALAAVLADLDQQPSVQIDPPKSIKNLARKLRP